MTNPTNGCIDQERELCAIGNNVELVIKRVESTPAFGSTPRERRFALAQLLGRLIGASSGDFGDEEYASVLQLTSLPGLEVTKEVRCVDTGENVCTSGVDVVPGSLVEYCITIRNTGNEDLTVTVDDLLQAVGPHAAELDCGLVCSGPGLFSARLTAPGRNRRCSVSDTGCTFDEDCPAGEECRGIIDLPITPGNAEGPPVCAASDAPDCLQREFFVPACTASGSFLNSIAAQTSGDLGVLRGAQVIRNPNAGPNDPPCELIEGDTLVLTFRARPRVLAGNEEAFCSSFEPVDCVNEITATGVVVGGTATVQDLPDVIDTDPERIANADDNVAEVNLLCRDIALDKKVQLFTDNGTPVGVAVDRLNIPTGASFPAVVEFSYTVTNHGEVAENITLSDTTLCTDVNFAIANTNGIALVPSACPLCAAAGTLVDPVALNAGQSRTYNCRVRFDDVDALRYFLRLDDNRPACTAGLNDRDCYRNCASVSADASANLGDVCGPAGAISADDFAEICNNSCDLDILKEVRCLPNCDFTNPGPWLPEESVLDVRASACVQYRIRGTNVSQDGVPICELLYDDLTTCTGNFARGPYDVIVQCTSNGLPDDLTCAPPFTDQFNWLGNPVRCVLVEPALPTRGALPPGDSCTVLFRADLKPQTAIDESCDPVNSITVLGAAEEDCALSDPPEYSCEDDSDVALDLGSCGLEVTKDVTCDEPRLPDGITLNPAAVWQPQLVETLPGAEVAFRVRVCNTGDTPLTGINLDDQLSCLPWYVPNSIAIDLDGANAEACLCPGGSPAGVCENIAELNGAKDLSGCPIMPGDCLTITFKVRVPPAFSTLATPVDCTNTVEVEGFTDACQFAGTNPCPIDQDFAQVNVLVPGVECEKEVCADVNRDGDCNDPVDFPFSSDLNLPCDIAFPFSLIYRVVTTNTGETPLANIRVCDPKLVADAVGAGFDVGPCNLCAPTGVPSAPPCDGVGDTCHLVPSIPVGQAATTLCHMVVPDRTAWDDFAGRDADNNKDCYVNTVGATVDVDTAGLCTRGADLDRDTSCDARVCLAPPCAIEVEKYVRCLEGCDDLGPFDVGTDALEAVPGATVEFEWKVTNAGDIPICALEVDDLLTGPFGDCETIPPLFECEVQPAAGPPLACGAEPPGNRTGAPFVFSVQQACGQLLDPGEMLVCRLRGIVPPTATGNNIVRNEVIVTCAPDDGGGCTAVPPVFCGNTDTDDALVDVQECDFDLEKYVSCDAPRLANGQLNPAATWEPDLEDALPGSLVAFRIEICNSGDVSLTALDLEDQLSCASWYVPNSIAVDIEGVESEACLCPGGNPAGVCETLAELNGPSDLANCPILPGECLNITFEVQVPDDFDLPGTPLDCENLIAVEPSTDVCQPGSPNPCPTDIDTAGINVDVPEIVCLKEVCADLNRDGDCTDAGDVPFTTALGLPCDTVAPFDLIYRISTTNIGETPLVNVDICDAQLIADAKAAGLTIVSCELCNDAACQTPGDSCRTIPSLAVGANASALCRIRVPGRTQWRAFAGSDIGIDPENDRDCYVNSSGVQADVNPAGYCTRGADADVATGCEATACWARPCVLEVQKDFRCVDGCTSRNPLGAWMDTLDATPGSFVEFRIDCANAGIINEDPDICALKFRDTTSGPFEPVQPGACRVVVVENDGDEFVCLTTNGVPDELILEERCGPPLAPGSSHLEVRCCGQIDDDATSADIISNGVTVEGAPACIGPVPDYCCDDADSALVDVDSCGFTLDKQVTCGDPADPDASFEPDDLADALPGSTLGFKFTICNTGDAPMETLDLNDQLSCLPWLVPNSIDATIEGDSVEPCLCPGGSPAGVCETLDELNGHKDLGQCPLEPDECLVVTFKVVVPPDFAIPGTSVDCTNTVTVEGFTDLCSNPLENPCGELTAAAQINVSVPSFECNKEITADWAPAGSVDAGPSDAIVVPEDAQFPVELVYTLQIINTGETALVSGTVCDGDLVQDAIAAGADVGPCDLCTAAPPCDGIGDTCSSLGSIPVGSTATATCTIRFDSETELEAFTNLDGTLEDNIYVNTMTADALVDTNGLCAPETPIDLPVRSCSAQVSRTEGNGECYPTTKATFTIWNQNETKFTGTHRCIPFWDQQPLSLYTTAGVPNSFLRTNLHTDKGKAFIDGLASQHCNVVDFDESIAAPLIGVAHKELTFNQSLISRGLAGMPLVALGSEDGVLQYTLSSGGVSKARNRGPQIAERAAARQREAAAAGTATAGSDSAGQIVVVDGGSESSPPAPVGQGAPADEPSRATGPSDDGPAFLACMGGPNRPPQPSGSTSVADCLALYDRDTDGDVDLADFSRGSTGANMNSRLRTEVSSLGSLLVFAKVEIRWNAAGELIQDTFLTLNNYASQDVAVQMYFVNGDKPLPANTGTGERAHTGCNWVDVQIELTRDEPTYWSAYTGLPKGVSPFTILDPGTPPGRPATDGTTDRVLRGYIVAWAVKPVPVNDRVRYHEISWNYLSGLATVVHYGVTEAWEYEAWPFAAVSAAQGQETDARPGSLRLNGVEYAAAPAYLVLDFYSAGSGVFSRPGYEVITQTDLTLLPMIVDLRDR